MTVYPGTKARLTKAISLLVAASQNTTGQMQEMWLAKAKELQKEAHRLFGRHK